jgi:Beta-lactamase superfamily domain
LHIRFCGVRGSSPAPGIDFVRYGGHTSCLALTHDGAPAPALILDAGAGLLSVSGLLDGGPFTGTILLFTAGDRAGARISVRLPEQENGESATTVLAGVMSPPYFPIGPAELRGEWTFATIAPGEHRIEGFTVLARAIPHKGGRTFGYRISDRRSTLAYMPDHCPTALGPGEDGFGEYHAAAVELAASADVLVHDAQLFPEELAAEASFGHSVADYAVGLAKHASARSVVLFHHRLDRTDDALDGLARRLGGGSSPSVRVAVEGTVLEL